MTSVPDLLVEDMPAPRLQLGITRDDVRHPLVDPAGRVVMPGQELGRATSLLRRFRLALSVTPWGLFETPYFSYTYGA